MGDEEKVLSATFVAAQQTDVDVVDLESEKEKQAFTVAVQHQQNNTLSVEFSNLRHKFENLKGHFKLRGTDSFETHLSEVKCADPICAASQGLEIDAETDDKKILSATTVAAQQSDVAVDLDSAEEKLVAIAAAQQDDVDRGDLKSDKEKLAAIVTGQ